MTDINILQKAQVKEQFADSVQQIKIDCNELTLVVDKKHLHDICLVLRNKPEFAFLQMLMDVCCVDYLHYGLSQWDTDSTTETGFSRGVKGFSVGATDDGKRGDENRGPTPTKQGSETPYSRRPFSRRRSLRHGLSSLICSQTQSLAFVCVHS